MLNENEEDRKLEQRHCGMLTVRMILSGDVKIAQLDP
jgi:hypothetical protein